MASTAVGLPVVDLRAPNFGDTLRASWRDVGFAAIVGHGVAPGVVASMHSICRRLFALDDVVKQRHRITRTNYRGFIPLGHFTPNRAEVNGTAPDLYEGYKLHWECPAGHPVRADCDLYGPNIWPEAVPGMRTVVGAYWSACDHAARLMLDEIAAWLDVGTETLRSWFAAPLTNMTLLHYPATAASSPAGIHAHKDTNVVTVLHPDPVGGLELRRTDGSWFEATAPAGALIVNVGEMLESWSGGELRATPHRVVNRSGLDRYSFPYFAVPNHDVVVEPLRACRPGYRPSPMPVGELSAEVWRTNWPDETPSAAGHDLGALDRVNPRA